MKTPSNHPSPSLLAELRSMPRPVWVLAIGVFINRFGTFVIPFLTLYMTKTGYSPSDIWKTFAALAAGGFISAILGGWMADRIGRRNTMSLALTSAAFAILGLWQADSLATYVTIASRPVAGFPLSSPSGRIKPSWRCSFRAFSECSFSSTGEARSPS